MGHKQPSPQHLAWLRDTWNDLYPVGTLIEYHPVIGESKHRIRRTRSEASILSNHTVVVFLEDETGCVAIEACIPVKERKP